MTRSPVKSLYARHPRILVCLIHSITSVPKLSSFLLFEYIFLMVNTRQQTLQEIPESQTQDRQQSRASSERPATPNSVGGPPAMPPRSPEGEPPRHSTPSHSSPSQSSVSLAGPGQRSRLLLSVATPNAREAYFIGLEKLNETFAQNLRESGVDIPRCEYFLAFHYSMCCRDYALLRPQSFLS